MVHCIISNCDKTIYDQDQTKVKTQFSPKTSIIIKNVKIYGAPQRGKKEKTAPKGPLGVSAFFSAASEANDRIGV